MKILKLFNGFASIRDYIVKDHINRQAPLVIEYGNRRMTLTPSDLVRKATQLTKEKILSKWQGEYELIDYLFEEDKGGEKQLEMF